MSVVGVVLPGNCRYVRTHQSMSNPTDYGLLNSEALSEVLAWDSTELPSQQHILSRCSPALHTWAFLLQASGFTEQLSQGPSSTFTEQPSRQASVNGAASALHARGQTIEDSDEEDQGDIRVGEDPQFDAEATWKDRLDEDNALGGEDYD